MLLLQDRVLMVIVALMVPLVLVEQELVEMVVLQIQALLEEVAAVVVVPVAELADMDMDPFLELLEILEMLEVVDQEIPVQLELVVPEVTLSSILPEILGKLVELVLLVTQEILIPEMRVVLFLVMLEIPELVEILEL